MLGIVIYMPRNKRITLGGYVYHALNRANGRLRIFRKDSDFLAFEQILAEGIERFDMRICGYCIIGNHWHLLLWPRQDGDLSGFKKYVPDTFNFPDNNGDIRQDEQQRSETTVRDVGNLLSTPANT
jgi:hypothetical protein